MKLHFRPFSRKLNDPQSRNEHYPDGWTDEKDMQRDEISTLPASPLAFQSNLPVAQNRTDFQIPHSRLNQRNIWLMDGQRPQEFTTLLPNAGDHSALPADKSNKSSHNDCQTDSNKRNHLQESDAITNTDSQTLISSKSNIAIASEMSLQMPSDIAKDTGCKYMPDSLNAHSLLSDNVDSFRAAKACSNDETSQTTSSVKIYSQCDYEEEPYAKNVFNIPTSPEKPDYSEPPVSSSASIKSSINTNLQANFITYPSISSGLSPLVPDQSSFANKIKACQKLTTSLGTEKRCYDVTLSIKPLESPFPRCNKPSTLLKDEEESSLNGNRVNSLKTLEYQKADETTALKLYPRTGSALNELRLPVQSGGTLMPLICDLPQAQVEVGQKRNEWTSQIPYFQSASPQLDLAMTHKGECYSH
ncbi:unnamed protein product, partial [Protopolystoma xenopodis]